jgi:hypothetical protein
MATRKSGLGIASEGEEMKPSDSYVQSFARGLEVLRSFGAGAAAQTLSETAERVGLTRAGAGNALRVLANVHHHLHYHDGEHSRHLSEQYCG